MTCSSLVDHLICLWLAHDLFIIWSSFFHDFFYYLFATCSCLVQWLAHDLAVLRNFFTICSSKNSKLNFLLDLSAFFSLCNGYFSQTQSLSKLNTLHLSFVSILNSTPFHCCFWHRKVNKLALGLSYSWVTLGLKFYFSW